MANPVLCANEIAIWFAELGMGDALPAGLAVGATGKITADQLKLLTEIKAAKEIEQQTGKAISAETLEKITHSSGGKGNWSSELNKPKPNETYPVDGNKVFKTDDLGRTSSVEAKLSLNTNDHNTYQQCKAGKCGISGDEGGHLIASRFNGPGEKTNLVPMNGNLNKGAWK